MSEMFSQGEIDRIIEDSWHEWQEQEPCDDEYIKVPKKALKYRTAGMVVYNAEWLKNHFDIERAVICGAQQSCEDTISRQEMIESIFDDDTEYTGSEICNIVRNLPPKQKTRNWIPVSERLPEEDVKVLTTIKWKDGSKYVGIDMIVGGKWMLNIPEDGDTTIAWMPLPKPYEPQEMV